MKFNILTFISAFMLSACSLIDERGVDCPPYFGEGSDNITLSFNMVTSDVFLSSRADDQHAEVGSELPQFEDAIDMKDCAMFIFVKMEDSDADDVLLVKNTALGSSNDIENYIAGAPGSYTVNLTIAKTTLNNLLNFELTPDGQQKIIFRVLLLANCYSSGTSSTGKKWDDIKGPTYADVISQLNEWSYSVGWLYNGNPGIEAISIFNKKKPPMMGTISIPVTQEALYYSRPDDRVYLGEMDLLRAIAKVRVIDNIQTRDINGYPQIVGVQFLSSQTAAKQMPFNAVNYENGEQVHIPNIADPGLPLNPQKDIPFQLGTIPDNWSITPPSERSGATWIGYVPEQRIDNINNDVNQGMPMFRITVALQKNADGSVDTQTYDVPMTGYKGQTFNFGENILRNHIYTLSVDEVALGTELNLTFNVENWNESSISLDYTESVTVSQPIQWLSGFEEYDSDGNVFIKPWTTGSDGAPTWVPLTARFGLSSPVGATWSAHLITVEGANVFEFIDSKGQLVPTVSGIVDGKTLSDLTIVSMDDEPIEVNSARLQVVVTLPNGTTVMEAPLIPTGASYKNYTIVQNPQ